MPPDEELANVDCRFAIARDSFPAFLIRLLDSWLPDSIAKKNAGRLLAIRHFDVQQQRLNCALIVVSSSLGFFRFQGLNGISEIPKNFGLSRRPIQSLL